LVVGSIYEENRTTCFSPRIKGEKQRNDEYVESFHLYNESRRAERERERERERKKERRKISSKANLV